MRKIAACLIVALLCACSSEPPPPVKQDIAPSGKLNLDVLTLNVLDRSNPPAADSPYMHNNFQPTIVAAIRQWAQQHLVAVGPTGDATLVIRDATLKSEPLPYKQDIFTRPQASKYIAHVEVEMVATGHEGHGEVTAEASRFVTLPENPTPIERQNAYNSVLNGLVHDLGANFDSGVRDHMGDFVITAPIMDVPAPTIR